ncbi:Zinc finger protein ZIC 5 [Coniochaeta hoffmannii]|uniref:Zinc finger protein ZIC 5 n=1 Tax=Coniochaeta hoffmannii TaxID=91930 RepID=A0AA38SM18_9PEZI|nr:Zinc finger protein ZIC 5 [Coniochaeta hoffmannii]
MEEPVFQPHPFQGHFSPVIGSYIDPNLQPPPTDPYLGQWEREPPQVKRWISDDQRTPLFNADPYSNVTTSVARSAMGTCPVPPRSQARFASPFSSSDHGLTAPSPLAETDSFYDNNMPSTPSDTAVLSPSYHPGHLEYYNSQEEAIQFGSMGPPVPPAYVKPEDVDPSRQLGYHDAEASQPGFSFEEHRSYSWHSGTSHNDTDTAQNQITVALAHRRMASPEEMLPMKTEPEASSQYPPLPDDDDEPVPEARPRSKRKKDDDYDYTPGKKTKSSNTSSSRRTRAKPLPKPSSPTRNPTASNRTPRHPATKPTTSSAARTKSLSCPHCKLTAFKDSSTLETHIKKQHTRPFKCVFHFAGCASTFASKNEWKRHNSTQHLVLHYWLCTEGQCGKTVNGASPASRSQPKPPRAAAAQVPNAAMYSNTFGPTQPPPVATSVLPSSPPATPGVRFNRKDLYTQHVRRMHMQPHVRKDLKLLDAAQKASSQSASHPSKGRKGPGPQSQSPLEMTKVAWDEQLRRRQESALRDRIVLPKYMRCPADGCGDEFKGADAWDLRMEHVAKHLESGDCGEVRFGGPQDTTLVEWAGSPEVGVIVRSGGEWVLANVMGKGGSGSVVREIMAEGGGGAGKGAASGDEDAEGEDDDDV